MNTMSDAKRWIELKQNTHIFTDIMNARKTLKRSTSWDDMTKFFREADKHLKI